MAERIEAQEGALTTGVEYRHVTINPSIVGWGNKTGLSHMCEALEAEGWALVRVVPHTSYETIAVFERVIQYDGTSDDDPVCPRCFEVFGLARTHNYDCPLYPPSDNDGTSDA